MKDNYGRCIVCHKLITDWDDLMYVKLTTDIAPKKAHKDCSNIYLNKGE